MSQICVENLTKTFKVAKRQEGLLGAFGSIVNRQYNLVHALEEISFSLDQGELVGYIGPNGAGKSTTVKIMSGILVPDSGKCEIMGKVPWKQRMEYVKSIGVVFGQRSQLWWDVPVIDSFELLRDIYRVPTGEYIKTKDELVERLNLSKLLDVPVRQLSLGQRMRCELAASLLHSPSILFLDEPTIGLDAVSKLAVREFIKTLNRERGVTVILTTHDMDDIEELCSRVMMIGKGKLLFDGSINELRNTILSERRIMVECVALSSPPSIANAQVIKHPGNRLELRFDPSKTTAIKLIQLVSNHCQVKDFIVEDPPIEEIIAKMYGVYEV